MKDTTAKIFYISFLIKLGLAISLPLSLDEMYYWLWGQFPQWSYFDHPPMVGWIMALGDLFKPLADGAVRWPFVVLSHLSIWLWFIILKPLIHEKYHNLWLLVALLNPLWGLGGIIATPDIPLVFFWTLAFYISRKIIQQPSANNYILFGAFLGLGFLSKYMIVLFPLCLLPWLFAEKRLQLLFNSKALLTLLFGFLFCGPVLFWNYQNDFASLSFQWKHGTHAPVWTWKWTLSYVLGQVFLIFPVFLWGLFKHRKDNQQLFFFSIIPLLFFFVTSFFSRVEANWPIVAYPALYAMMFLKQTTKDRFVVWTTRLWGGLALFILAFVFASSFRPNLKEKAKTKLFEAHKYKAVYEFSQNHKNLVANSYQMAGFLSFKHNNLYCKLPEVEGRVDFFNYLEECKEKPEHFYVITKNRNINVIQNKLSAYQVLKQEVLDDNFVAYEVKKK